MPRASDADVADSSIAQSIDDLIHLMEGHLGLSRDDRGMGFHVNEFAAQFSIGDEAVAHTRPLRHDKDSDLSRAGTRAFHFSGAVPFARAFHFATSFTGTVALAPFTAGALLFPLGASGTVALALSLPRTISLAGRLIFVGRGGAEGDGHDPGDAGDEQGVEPCIFSDGVCDHLNALLQGGMVTDTRRHPCDGGRRKKFALHPKQGATVVETLGGAEPRKGAGVAEQLAVRLKAGDGDPDDGIEPMDRVDEGGEPVLQDIVTADVLELVHQNEAQGRGIKTRFPVAGQDEPGMGHTADGRRASGGTEDGAKILTNTKFLGHLSDLSKEASVATKLEPRPLLKTTLAPKGRQTEQNRPDSPSHDEQSRPQFTGLRRNLAADGWSWEHRLHRHDRLGLNQGIRGGRLDLQRTKPIPQSGHGRHESGNEQF